MRRVKYFGRSITEAHDHSIYVLSDLFVEMYSDLLFVTLVLFFFFSTTDYLSARIVKQWSRLPLNITAHKAGKGILIDASILRYSIEEHTMGIPLATITVGTISLLDWPSITPTG